jgi:CspA family cold shock protein
MIPFARRKEETYRKTPWIPSETIMTGTIKKIIKDKGFGFITPDDGSDEIFFHRSRLAPKVYFEDLREGAEVQFETRPGDKGPQAFNLRLR